MIFFFFFFLVDSLTVWPEFISVGEVGDLNITYASKIWTLSMDIITYLFIIDHMQMLQNEHIHYISLTTFFAENKDKFSSTVFDVSVNVCHQTY